MRAALHLRVRVQLMYHLIVGRPNFHTRCSVFANHRVTAQSLPEDSQSNTGDNHICHLTLLEDYGQSDEFSAVIDEINKNQSEINLLENELNALHTQLSQGQVYFTRRCNIPSCKMPWGSSLINEVKA
jgi:hypothetical protein